MADQPYTVNQKFEGHGLWQFEEFIRGNAQQYGVREISRKTEKEVKKNFEGEGETVEFDLIMMSDGSSIKCSFKITPPKNKNDSAKGSTFSMDLSNIRTPEQAKEAFDKFHALTTDFALKNHPANKPAYIFTNGPEKWKEIGNQSKIESIQKRAEAFRERGIEVYLNNQLIIGRKPEDDLKTTKRLPKAFDVPRVPKLTRGRTND